MPVTSDFCFDNSCYFWYPRTWNPYSDIKWVPFNKVKIPSKKTPLLERPYADWRVAGNGGTPTDAKLAWQWAEGMHQKTNNQGHLDGHVENITIENNKKAYGPSPSQAR